MLAAANSAVRVARSRHVRALTITMSQGKIASGTRLGRITMAIALSIPAPTVRPGVPPTATDSAPTQNVAAGTSAIGSSDMKTTTGLQATSAAATAAGAVPKIGR